MKTVVEIWTLLSVVTHLLLLNLPSRLFVLFFCFFLYFVDLRTSFYVFGPDGDIKSCILSYSATQRFQSNLTQKGDDYLE